MGACSQQCNGYNDDKADDKKEKGRDQLLFYPGPGFDGMVSVVKSLDNGIKTIGRKNNSQEKSKRQQPATWPFNDIHKGFANDFFGGVWHYVFNKVEQDYLEVFNGNKRDQREKYNDHWKYGQKKTE